MTIPQGDLRLLDTDGAQRLLHSTIPARLGYVAGDGTPRVVPTWYVWTGDELVMSTFVHCPPIGITTPVRRLAALRARPDVAVTVDTESAPHDVLMLRGRVSIIEVDGVTAEQAQAARRFCGEEGGRSYVDGVTHPDTRMARIALRPSWVGLLDYRERLPAAMGGAAS